MLHKHYFGYRKWKDGKPTNIQIEVIVAANVSRLEAQRIAQEEIIALLRGQRFVDRRGLNAAIRAIERRATPHSLTSYTLMGVN